MYGPSAPLHNSAVETIPTDDKSFLNASKDRNSKTKSWKLATLNAKFRRFQHPAPCAYRDAAADTAFYKASNTVIQTEQTFHSRFCIRHGNYANFLLSKNLH
jgi:hypothetical protein